MTKSRNRRRKSAPASAAKSSREEQTPWYKRTWILLGTLAAAVAAIGVKGPDAIDGLRKLPAKLTETYDQFSAWKGEDTEWSGVWSNNIEGYVDSGDMQISEVDMRLELKTEKGVLTGIVASRSICKTIPIFNFVMVEGKSSFSKADVEIFDHIGGKRQLFMRLHLQRDGPVLTVQPIDDHLRWFPGTVRLARSVTDDQAANDKVRDSYCAAERADWAAKNLTPRKP